MKIVLLSTGDITGGAAVVTQRLTDALCRAGADATMVVANRRGDSPHTVKAPGLLLYKWQFLAERLPIFAANGFSRGNLFKVDTGAKGLPLWRVPAVEEADIVVVAWVNQGFLSLSGLQRIAEEKPVVVVMHDMWWMTGICHHAMLCQRYWESCGCCPLLDNAANPKKAEDLSHRVWLRKKEIYRNSNLHFVAVSSWLASHCRESSLLGEKEVTVIPNVMPVDSFISGPFESRAELGIPDSFGTREKGGTRQMIAMGAARLDDLIKGLPLAIETLNRLQGMAPDRFCAVFFGGLKNRDALSDLKMPYHWTGPLTPVKARSVFRQASFVISTSEWETLPTTLIEGQAAGAYPASFDRGGQRDIIDSEATGALVPYGDTEAMARALIHASEKTPDPRLLQQSVTEKFSEEAVARRYMCLFRSIAGRS